ncbi:MAG: DnaJ domain-containing protein [Candidatus Heimdallarchaeaceae archaeon]
MDSEKLGDFILVFIILLYGAAMVKNIFQIFNHSNFSSTQNPNAINKKNQWKKAAKAFGVGVTKLKKMTKDEIKALYRKMAMKNHPDRGGNAEKFRNLHEAYEFAYAA